MARFSHPLVLCAAITASCGGDDAPRKPVPPGWEATVEFSHTTRHLPAGTSVVLYATEEFTEESWLDAGSRVTFTGPAGDVELVRREHLGRIFYQKEPGTDIDPALFVNDASYGLDVSGSSRDYGVPGFELAGAILTPQDLDLTAPDVSTGEVTIAAAASALTVSWVPGDGDRVEVILAVASAGLGNYVSYASADDGELIVPGIGLAALPPGEGALTVVRLITTPLELPDDGTGTGIGGDAVECRLVRE